MDSFKKHHHKRHGGHHHHHHHKKQFGDYQTILDPMQPQPNNNNQMYLDEKPIQLEEQKTFTDPHHKKEFNKDFKHKDHSHHHHSRGGFGKDRSRDGFKKQHHHHHHNHHHHHQHQIHPEESIPLETITNVKNFLFPFIYPSPIEPTIPGYRQS